MRGLNKRQKWLAAAMAASMTTMSSPAFAQLQSCKAEELFAVVDRTGQRLREINSSGQPRMRAKLQELAKKNGWADADVESKGAAAIEDDVVRGMDARAAELLADIDRLADVQDQDDTICKRLDEARTKSSQLIEITQQRSTHALARIDLALKPALPGATAPVAAAQTPAAPPPATVASSQPTAAESATRPATAPPRPKAGPAPTWETRTLEPKTADFTRLPDPKVPDQRIADPRIADPRMTDPRTADARGAREVTLTPLPADAMNRPTDPGSLGFSPEEINAAGRGVFGTISAGLAGVIDFAFQKYGRPTGYIIGDEGGGAFFAGLRYGEGRIVTKAQGERRVYWQGPSAGFDFGLAGSQVMFLVYGLDEQDQLYQRFTGVDGSAYLVGGVGITFMKRGKVVLAPIRTGLGVRVGANVGYLKFTPTPSLNPF